MSPFLYSARCAMSVLIVLVHFGALLGVRSWAGMQIVCLRVCVGTQVVCVRLCVCVRG